MTEQEIVRVISYNYRQFGFIMKPKVKDVEEVEARAVKKAHEMLKKEDHPLWSAVKYMHRHMPESVFK